MAMRQRPGKVAHMYKLDSEPYAQIVKEARKAAARVLKPYGEPIIPLTELRTRLDNELGQLSLTKLILKEREAGW